MRLTVSMRLSEGWAGGRNDYWCKRCGWIGHQRIALPMGARMYWRRSKKKKKKTQNVGASVKKTESGVSDCGWQGYIAQDAVHAVTMSLSAHPEGRTAMVEVWERMQAVWRCLGVHTAAAVGDGEVVGRLTNARRHRVLCSIGGWRWHAHASRSPALRGVSSPALPIETALPAIRGIISRETISRARLGAEWDTRAQQAVALVICWFVRLLEPMKAPLFATMVSFSRDRCLDRIGVTLPQTRVTARDASRLCSELG